MSFPLGSHIEQKTFHFHSLISLLRIICLTKMCLFSLKFNACLKFLMIRYSRLCAHFGKRLTEMAVEDGQRLSVCSLDAVCLQWRDFSS